MASSVKDYERNHKKVFSASDELTSGMGGRYAAGCGNDGMWTYLVWGSSAPYLAHELSHVILHVFERSGIDPREARGEPFCYMLSQLMLEAQ